MSKKDNTQDQYRITTLLTAKEKAALKKKAWRSGRTMSSYLRYLVIEDCDLSDND